MIKWCMCEKVGAVAKDGKSTCLICGGIDAYKMAVHRPQRIKMIERREARKRNCSTCQHYDSVTQWCSDAEGREMGPDEGCSRWEVDE